MKFIQIIKTIFVLFILSVLVSCGSTDSASSNVGSGRVSLLITDGPTNDFDQINITLESISFLSDDEDSSQEVILFEETRIINLLALQNYSDWLSTTTVPAGIYSKIRLHVSKVELVKLNPDGSVLSSDIAKLPANGKIDLNPKGSFEVVGDGHLMIELDMDAEKSIHIVETGNGKFIFRPVIFVNILGADELKLVIVDGKVLASSESGFQLCEVDTLQVNDNCLVVLISANTVVQDDMIDPGVVDDNDFVTVLGKAGSENINALHIVIAADDKDIQNLALFTGKATSAVALDDSFSMKTDDENDVVAPETMLTVTLATSARVFDKFGTEVASDNIINGSDLDVFGLAMPDLATVTGVKAAFAIVNNDVEADKVSGIIAAINAPESEITVSVVTDFFSGDVCIDIATADIFLLNIVGGNINSDEIGINELNTGMSVDVYGEDKSPDCLSANVVLASAN